MRSGNRSLCPRCRRAQGDAERCRYRERANLRLQARCVRVAHQPRMMMAVPGWVFEGRGCVAGGLPGVGAAVSAAMCCWLPGGAGGWRAVPRTPCLAGLRGTGRWLSW